MSRAVIIRSTAKLLQGFLVGINHVAGLQVSRGEHVPGGGGDRAERCRLADAGEEWLEFELARTSSQRQGGSKARLDLDEKSLCLRLAPLALGIVFFYSFTKRFTSFSHLVLGFSLGIAPAAAWIAVRGSLDPRILWLTAAVTFWTAGFDVIYSCQDFDFDRSEGLFSVPRVLGIAGALLLAAASFSAYAVQNDAPKSAAVKTVVVAPPKPAAAAKITKAVKPAGPSV